MNLFLALFALIFVPLYPKFPLFGVSGSFVSVRLEDFVLAAVVGIWFLASLFKKFRSIRGPVQRAILLYIFIGLVSVVSGILLTKTVTLSLGFIHWFRRVEYLVMFAVAYDSIVKKEQINLVIKILFGISIIAALYGLGQLYLSFPVISTSNTEFAKGLSLTLGPESRINSTFAGHYDLAAFSLFPIMLSIAFLSLKEVTKKSKLFLSLTGTITYLAMLNSASRVTFAAFFMITAMLLITIRKKIWLPLLVIVSIASVLLTPQLAGRYYNLIKTSFLASVPNVYATEVPTAVDKKIPDALKVPEKPEDRSLNIRLQASWPKAFRALEKNPLLGTGFSSIGLAADNGYLRSLAEVGILGFIAFGLIIYRCLRSSFPFFTKPKKDVSDMYIISVSFGLIGLLINTVFIDIFEASKIAIVTWILLGFSEKLKTLKNHDR